MEIYVYVHQITVEIKKISSTLKYPFSLTKPVQVIRILILNKFVQVVQDQ